MSFVEAVTMRASFALIASLAWTLGSVSTADAQARFSEAEARAQEIAVDRLADRLAPLLADCSAAATPSAERACVAARRREGRDLLRQTFLLEMPAEGHVHLGSYEPANGGFRISAGGFVLARSVGPGVLATSPTTRGRLPEGASAKQGFVVVPWIGAERWLATHRTGELVLRLIVRAGEDFQDPSAPEPAARYGVRLEVLGMQLYGDTSGEVLVDTYAQRLPVAPARLEDRTRLWSHVDRNEGLFVAEDGTEALLNVRLEERAPGDTTITAVLMQTVGATSIEIFRVHAPCCSSSIDVRRHGATKLLAIVTEQSSEAGSIGRGRVVLLAWDPSAHVFEQRAEWVGSNDASPPPWVLDPSVDP